MSFVCPPAGAVAEGGGVEGVEGRSTQWASDAAVAMQLPTNWFLPFFFAAIVIQKNEKKHCATEKEKKA